MKITQQELEIRVKREIDNYYNYVYTPGEISREQTSYYFLIKDIEVFKKKGGNVNGFKMYLQKLIKENLKNEQKDFLFDLIIFTAK